MLKYKGIQNGRVFLEVPFNEKETFKAVPTYSWHKDIKLWSINLDKWDLAVNYFPELACATADIERWKEDQKSKKVDQAKVFEEKVVEYAFKRQPYQHQKDMMKKCVTESKFALFCEMGTGKSQALVNTFDYFLKHGIVKHVLVVCPKTIIMNWVNEVNVNSDGLKIAVVDGSQKERIKLLNSDAQVYVINYEGVRIIEFDWKKFDCVILDESSKIKNHESQTTKKVLKIFTEAPYKYIASGTPLQTPMDIYTQMRFLDPNIFGFNSFYSFRNYYAVMGGYGGYEVISYKNMPELKNRIKNFSVQLRKEQCIDLPEKIYTQRSLPMAGEIKEQYDQMLKNSVLITGSGDTLTAPIVLTELLRLQEITSGLHLKDQKYNHKLKEVLSIINDNTSESVVIWCRFKKSISLINEILAKNNILSVTLDGDVPMAERQLLIDRFQNKEARVFIGQIATGGMGINLTAGSIVIYYENTFSLAERKQSEDRCHRIGQKKAVVYIDIGYEKTVDNKIIRAISSKQEVATYIIDSFKKGEYKKEATHG